MPVLLVRGEHSDVVSGDDIDHFRQLVPQTTVAVVVGAHHMVAGDRNDAFADVIAGYLDDEGLRTVLPTSPIMTRGHPWSSPSVTSRGTTGRFVPTSSR